MEHGEEIQLAESGKIQVIDTCFSVSARPVRNYCFALKQIFLGWVGGAVGYWSSRRSLCIMIVCRAFPSNRSRIGESAVYLELLGMGE